MTEVLAPLNANSRERDYAKFCQMHDKQFDRSLPISKAKAFLGV